MSPGRQRVEVRAVVVEESTGIVDDVGDLGDVALEEADRVRIGEHECGGVLADGRPERVEVDATVVAGGEFDHVVAGGRGGGEVRPVCRRGDHHLRAVGTVVFVIRLRHEDPGELTCRARRRLEGDGVHATDLGEDVL